MVTLCDFCTHEWQAKPQQMRLSKSQQPDEELRRDDCWDCRRFASVIWSFYKQWVSNICHSSMGRASKSAKAEMLKSWLTHLPESADGCTTLRQSEPPICYKLHGNPHLGFTIKCLIIWSSDGISRNVSCEVEFAFPCYFPAIDRRCVSVNLHIY